MKEMLLAKNKHLRLAIILTILAHLLLVFFFSLVYLKSQTVPTSEQIISIIYKRIEDQKKRKANLRSIHLDSKPQKPTLTRNTQPKKIELTQIKKNDDYVITKSSSENLSENLPDSSHTFNELVINNPNLIVLKMALIQNIKNKIIKKTEAEIAVEGLKKYMNDYYKLKYPTPLSKFGDPGRGSMLSIPVDDVIKLFK